MEIEYIENVERKYLQISTECLQPEQRACMFFSLTIGRTLSGIGSYVLTHELPDTNI